MAASGPQQKIAQQAANRQCCTPFPIQREFEKDWAGSDAVNQGVPHPLSVPLVVMSCQRADSGDDRKAARRSFSARRASAAFAQAGYDARKIHGNLV
jgi:hypothetical protein